jgi:hypothetical protein
LELKNPPLLRVAKQANKANYETMMNSTQIDAPSMNDHRSPARIRSTIVQPP